MKISLPGHLATETSRRVILTFRAGNPGSSPALPPSKGLDAPYRKLTGVEL